MNEIESTQLSLCIDGYLEGSMYDENEVPTPVDPRATSRKELALARYKLWQPGQELLVGFLDGTEALHKRVENEARKWLDYANLKFVFGNFGEEAQIRVTFIGTRYQSLVGTDALNRPFPQPTMMLGGFTEFINAGLLRRVTIHEFGHAIGCVHEQSSPSINIPWDKKKCYAYYARMGWDKATVDHNVFRRYGKSEVDFTDAHDPKSIMQYPVPNELTIGDFEIGWNTELSGMDKLFIAKMYPQS